MRRAKLLTGGAAATLVAFAGMASMAVLPASAATLTSQTYTIGAVAGSPTNVAVAATSMTAGAAAGYTLTFKSPGGSLTAGSTITLYETDSNGATAGGILSAITAGHVFIGDASDPGAYALQAPQNISAVTPAVNGVSSVTLTLGGTGTIPANDTTEVTFSGTNPAAGTYTLGVGDSVDGTPAYASAIALTGTAAASVTVTPLTGGAVGSYSFSAVPVDTVSGTVTLTAANTGGTAGTTAWSTDPASYTVTVTPSGGGTATSDAVTGVTTTTAGPTQGLDLATGLTVGETLAITAVGTNPPDTATNSYSVSVDTAGAVGSATFGTSVSGVTVTPSPTTASASSTYVVGFTATTTVTTGNPAPPTGTITITLPADTSATPGTTTAVLDDTSTGAVASASLVAVSNGAGTDNVVTVTLPAGYTIAAGNHETVTLTNVTNPGVGETETSATVATSTDTVPATASAYSIIPASSVAAPVTVAVTPSSPGLPATYTVGNLIATSALTGGSGTIELKDSSTSTIFPNVPSDYTITDSTTPSASGTVSTIVSGGGTYDVVLDVPNTINSGDKLTVTANDVLNPPAGAYSLNVISSAIGAVALPVFPNAATTMSDGSIVNFAGTFYVFAGGHAFGIPSPTVLAGVQAVDHAAIISAPTGTLVPTLAARAGTMVVVDGTSTVYVVGTDGLLHGFATPTQLQAAGYDGALIITVPNLGGMTVGSTVGAVGAGANALATSADGSIINDNGTFYVFAGGHAFGIPTPAALMAVQASEPIGTTPLAGSIASPTGPVATGTMVTYNGTVYISSAGTLYPFKTMAQLMTDGYGGTPSVAVPNIANLTAVTSYSGS